MSNKNFQTEENEILSPEDEKVRQMLGSLERIDAPKDFDFRLKARIANAEPQNFQPRLFPILRYAAPLALAIAVLAGVVVNNLYSVDDGSVAVTNKNVEKPIVENVELPNNSQPDLVFAASNSPSVNTETAPAFAVNKNNREIKPFSNDSELAANIRKPKKDEPKIENEGGGSKDFSATNPDDIKPQGFSSNNTFPVKDVLSTIGIEASFADKKWTVKSVTQNSQVGRLGVKANDVIDAINENKLSTETISVKGSLNVNKLTVMRGAERIEINLQSK